MHGLDQHVTSTVAGSRLACFFLGVGMTLGGLLATGFAALNLGTLQSFASPGCDTEFVKQIAFSIKEEWHMTYMTLPSFPLGNPDS